MQCTVLIGEKSLRDEFVARFLREHSIPSFLTIRLEDTKIADVRELKKLFAAKISRGQSRVCIVEGIITAEAQHALLKLTEELSEDTYMIFSSREEYFLPTILSRSRIVRLRASPSPSKNLEELFGTRDSPLFPFKLSEALDRDRDGIKNVILTLRGLMKQAVEAGEKEKVRDFSQKLEKLLAYDPIAQHNNVNQKMILETTFLDS